MTQTSRRWEFAGSPAFRFYRAGISSSRTLAAKSLSWRCRAKRRLSGTAAWLRREFPLATARTVSTGALRRSNNKIKRQRKIDFETTRAINRRVKSKPLARALALLILFALLGGRMAAAPASGYFQVSYEPSK